MNHQAVKERSDEIGTLVTRTNKAEIFRTDDGAIVKRYFTSNATDRARQDQRSLQHIYKIFGSILRNGWDYRSVKPLWFDCERGLVCMEKAPGTVIATLPKSDLLEAEYHAGVWLGLYHNRALENGLHGKIFTDLTVHNIMVDMRHKIVTAIDPGAMWQRNGCAYEDVAKHLHSVSVGLIAKRRASFASIFRFLKGYQVTVEAKFRVFMYYKSLLREFTRQYSNYLKSSLVRSLVFPIWIGLFSPFYFVVVPVYLSRAKSNVLS